MTDDLERARQARQRRRVTGPARTSGPAGEVLAKVGRAAERRDPAAYYAGKTPTRQRITTALDLCGLYGPEVDRALGGEEPMVDEWESGARVPDFGQVRALAVLTGFPLKFFYMPPPQPVSGGFICGPGGCEPMGRKPGHACEHCGCHSTTRDR